MKKQSLFCLLLCLCLLTASGCGKAQTAADPTTEPYTEPAAAAVTQTQTVPDETQTAPDETVSETQAAADASEPDSTTETETEAFDPHNGLTSTNVEDVLAYYQWAAAFNDKNQYAKTLELISMDAGNEKINKYMDMFESIAKKAVAKNSVSEQALPGKYKTLRPSDWSSAEAVTDGTYTTITVKVAPQTDGAYGKEFDGPVGRTMTVLNGVAAAIDELPGVSADFENGEVQLEYQNPTMKVKIDNRTGLFVPGSCTWSYRVDARLVNLDAKVLAFNIHLENAEGLIDYKMSY